MALDDGQAGTDLAPAPFDDLVGLLLDDPSSDAWTAEDGGVGEGGTDLATQANPDGSPDLLADEDIGNLDPDTSLSPNRSRLPLDKRTGQQAASQQGRTFQVTVKGDDGADQTIAVDEKERGAGYLRHAQFTKLTQELSVQRAQVMEVADGKIQAFHKQALDSVQRASAVITRLAGFMTPEEMHALAISNPNAYNAEQARVGAVKAQIEALDREAAAIVDSAKKAGEESLNAAYVACWNELARQGLITITDQGKVAPESEAKLKRTFEEVIKHFGIPASRFATINDPKLIAMMLTAVEMLDLKARAADRDVGAKAQLRKPPPRVPTARQHTPRQTVVNRDLEGRFNSRRGATTNDLARWLTNNE